VRSIGDRAFEESGLISIDFEADSSLSEIGDSAFEGCKALKSITLPVNVMSNGESTLMSIEFDNESLLGEIGDNVFYGCKALDSITLPASVRSIGDRAFEESGLISIDFEADSSLSEIGDNVSTSDQNHCSFSKF